MKNKLVFLLLLLPVLSACVQTKIIDQLNLITAAGVEYDNDKLKLTVIYPKYLPDKSVQNQSLTVKLDKNGDILDHLDRVASQPILVGDLDVFVLGKNVAEGGIFTIIDTLQREPSIGSRLFMIISDGSMTELLTGTYDSQGNSKYITDMIDHNMKYRDIPKTNLHLFASNFFQKGKDAYLPILKKVNDGELKIDGMGIFKEDKLVHILPAPKMFYFKLLVDKHTVGSMSVKVGKEIAVINDIKTRVSVTTNYEELTFDINYKISGVVKKYTGKKINPQTIENIKKAVEKKVEKECLELLKEFQALNIDPVGIERKFKQQNRNFDSKRWKDQYKDVKFNIHPKVIIPESGTVE